MTMEQYRRGIDAKEWVEKNIDIDDLIISITSAVGEAARYGNEVDGKYEAYVFDLVSGSYGRYQARTILEAFGYEVDEDFESDEWVFYEIDDFASKVAEEINKEIRKRGLQGDVSFGHLESDGSYGLFYYVDKELVL